MGWVDSAGFRVTRPASNNGLPWRLGEKNLASESNQFLRFSVHHEVVKTFTRGFAGTG